MNHPTDQIIRMKISQLHHLVEKIRKIQNQATDGKKITKMIIKIIKGKIHLIQAEVDLILPQ
jgi:hypothetical protein